jgi:hypothetical protein
MDPLALLDPYPDKGGENDLQLYTVLPASWTLLCRKKLRIEFSCFEMLDVLL